MKKTITYYDLQGNVVYHGDKIILKKFSLIVLFRVMWLRWDDYKILQFKKKNIRKLLKGVHIKGTDKYVRAKPGTGINILESMWISSKPISSTDVIVDEDGVITLIYRDKNEIYNHTSIN
jgi:hypothetical protein